MAENMNISCNMARMSKCQHNDFMARTMWIDPQIQKIFIFMTYTSTGCYQIPALNTAGDEAYDGNLLGVRNSRRSKWRFV